MSASKLRVIVVGGGPVGLTAAHALTKAGIDFLVLERRPQIVIDAGSNLVLSPVGLRTLDQLGVIDQINAVSSTLGQVDRIDHAGRNLGDVEFFKQMAKNTGIALRVISRHDLTRVLYDTLPASARQKLLGGKKLSAIATHADGVTVTCADGSTYAASAVIGADGAHSLTRDLMRREASDSGSSKINAETPFLTTYRCLWVRFPTPTGVDAGTVCETHGKDAATQFFTGKDSGVIGVYEHLEKPTKERTRYTQADQETFIDRWGHLPITLNAKMTLRDVYDSRLESGLVSLEEGVVDHWSFDGRIVLVGDSKSKFTPSLGSGCNNGLIDIVVLVNQLRAAIQNAQTTSGVASPSQAQLDTAFQAYQNIRQDAVKAECAASGQATTSATWQTGIHKFIDRNIMSYHFVSKFLINLGAKKVAAMPTFDFVDCKLENNGRVPWKTPMARTVMAA